MKHKYVIVWHFQLAVRHWSRDKQRMACSALLDLNMFVLFNLCKLCKHKSDKIKQTKIWQNMKHKYHKRSNKNIAE